LEPLSCRSGKLIVQVTPITAVSYRKGMAEHTGQSSQLFLEANDRSAQFLSTVTKSALIRQAIDVPQGVAIRLR
jgi:hypothetical protein